MVRAASDRGGTWVKAINSHSAPTWFLLLLLLLGVIASVVGYIGCFSVVQSAEKSTGPLSWLCLESALSLLRMYIWGLNPVSDDAPPLEFVLKLDEEPPLPTCNMYHNDIEAAKVLPLTRASQFLNSITSFAGLVERFDHPDLTLYYTLTRKGASDAEQDTYELLKPGERVLYITIFDHKERTTRIYTRVGTDNGFYSTKSDVPAIDLKHGVLEAQLDLEIDRSNDPIAGDDDIRLLLETHYRSIMDEIHFTMGERHRDRTYIIENNWTLNMADTISARQRKREMQTLRESETGERTWSSVVQSGKKNELDDAGASFERDVQYLGQGRLESMLRTLYTTRGQWIEGYLDWVFQEAREALKDEKGITRRVDGQTVADTQEVDGKQRATSGGERFPSESDATVDDPVSEEIELLFIDERCWVEKLLVFEVERWEEQVMEMVQEFVGRDGVPEKERLMREWRANCWKRLDTNIRAMDARMEDAKSKANAGASEVRSKKWHGAHFDLRYHWQSVVERFVESSTPSPLLSMPSYRLDCDVREIVRHSTPFWWTYDVNAAQQRRVQRHLEEMASRLEKELEDVEFRLNQGLERCDEFRDDPKLFQCRHARSKWLILNQTFLKSPFEAYSRALKQNSSFIYIIFDKFQSEDEYQAIADTIRDTPWVTSIWVEDRRCLPEIQRDAPLFVHDDHGSADLETFLENDPRLALTRDTFTFFSDLFTFAISFVGPTCANLIRLTHRSIGPDATLTVKEAPLRLTVPSSLTVDDITLPASPSESDQSSFQPGTTGTRQNMIIQVTANLHSYFIHNIQLLDEAESGYDLASGEVSAKAPRCVCPSSLIYHRC